MENEYIVVPAIRKDNKIRISRFSHAEMIGCDCFFKGAEQGFITNLDRFVDRKEALKIAEKNNKGLNKFYKSDELYSEDLFKTEFKLAKENKELRENYICAQANANQVFDILKNYVPVQTIKAKIEELETELKKAEKDLQEAIRLEKEAKAKEGTILWWTAQIRLDERIKTLKEILRRIKKD